MRHLSPTLAVLLLAVTTTAAPPTVSRETTYYLGPLDDEGYVDYAAAINQNFGNGIKPEDNAFAGILARLDPALFSFTHLGQLYAELGIKPDADFGKKYILIDKYAERGGLSHREAIQQFEAALNTLWTVEKYPHVASWLNHNEPALVDISVALKRPAYFSPIVLHLGHDTLMAANFSHHGPLRALARTYILRADMYFAAGNHLAAVEDLASLRRLAAHLTSEPSLIGNLIGVSIFSQTDSMLVRWIESGQLDGTAVDLILNNQQRIPPLNPMRNSILDGYELNLTLDAITKLNAGKIDMSEIMVFEVVDDPGPERRQEIDRFYRRLFEHPNYHVDLSLKLINRQMHAYPRIEEAETYGSYRSRLDQAVDTVEAQNMSPEYMTNVFVQHLQDRQPGDTQQLTEALTYSASGMLIPAVTAAYKAAGQLRIRHRLVDTAIRVEKYRSVQGQYPRLLDDLVPEYSEELPMDMADGESLRYRRLPSGYLLYSVGTNLTDEGGESSDPDKGDIVIRVEQRR